MNVSRQCIRIFTPILRYPPSQPLLQRALHSSKPLAQIKPFLLPDIGEGIKEVQIIQWFVEPEARVEQFDKLCEVQSDKAAAEITSRYDGVIKKIHYEAEDMAQVGKPLCDIDVQSDSADDEPQSTLPTELAVSSSSLQPHRASSSSQPQRAVEQHQNGGDPGTGTSGTRKGSEGKHASLATPAVRGLLKELEVNIVDVKGTGKDGRVMKEDVYKFAEARDAGPISAPRRPRSPSRLGEGAQVESRLALTPIQAQMFKTMTRSLTIPQFLYADEINLTPLSTTRQRINVQSPALPRLSFLPFIIKAVSLALEEFPLLNSRIEVGNGQDAPQLIRRDKHNVGIAMDTPHGLLVPNIKDISSLSIRDIAAELRRLQALAQAGTLAAADLTGGTITVSNIGTIGGTYVAPVIVSHQVAILGIGKARTVPAFDAHDRLVKREVAHFSWSADHRVVDGATMAKMAEKLRGWVEMPELMMARLR